MIPDHKTGLLMVAGVLVIVITAASGQCPGVDIATSNVTYISSAGQNLICTYDLPGSLLTGATITIGSDSIIAIDQLNQTCRGIPFLGIDVFYRLEQVLIQTSGGQHAIDGVLADLEIQLIHVIASASSLLDALTQSNGVVVLVVQYVVTPDFLGNVQIDKLANATMNGVVPDMIEWDASALFAGTGVARDKLGARRFFIYAGGSACAAGGNITWMVADDVGAIGQRSLQNLRMISGAVNTSEIMRVPAVNVTATFLDVITTVISKNVEIRIAPLLILGIIFIWLL